MKELNLRLPYRYRWSRSQSREQAILFSILFVVSAFFIAGWLWIFFCTDISGRWFYGMLGFAFIFLEIYVAIGLWISSYSRGLKIAVNENGIVVETSRIPSVTYKWEEIQSCGVGYIYDGPTYMTMYFSKLKIDPPRFSSWNYMRGADGVYREHRMWNKILAKNKLLFSGKAQYDSIVNVPVRWDIYDQFLEFLPLNLKEQLEQSQETYFRSYPEDKNWWNHVCTLYRIGFFSTGKLNLTDTELRITRYRGQYLMRCPWSNVRAIGMDYYIFDSVCYPYLYMSKKEIPLLDYKKENYIAKYAGDYLFHSFWKQFFKENHDCYEQHENIACIRLEVSASQLAQLKSRLPAHLLAQLEETEARMYAENPEMKPIK